jgi:hypothetical protein
MEGVEKLIYSCYFCMKNYHLLSGVLAGFVPICNWIQTWWIAGTQVLVWKQEERAAHYITWNQRSMLACCTHGSIISTRLSKLYVRDHLARTARRAQTILVTYKAMSLRGKWGGVAHRRVPSLPRWVTRAPEVVLVRAVQLPASRACTRNIVQLMETS